MVSQGLWMAGWLASLAPKASLTTRSRKSEFSLHTEGSSQGIWMAGWLAYLGSKVSFPTRSRKRWVVLCCVVFSCVWCLVCCALRVVCCVSQPALPSQLVRPASLCFCGADAPARLCPSYSSSLDSQSGVPLQTRFSSNIHTNSSLLVLPKIR
jgi:hypothetical protein